MNRATVRDAVRRLADEGVKTFTVGDLRHLLDLTPQRARHLAFRLNEANLARRIKRGRYVLLHAADWNHAEALGGNWHLLAGALVEPDPYYLAYYTAMDLHGMVQHPLRTVFVAVTKQRDTTTLGPVRFRFVKLGVDKFFGFKDMGVGDGDTVKVAELERTFIDAVDRPELCGGLEEVFRGFVRRHGDLNRDRMLTYVLRLDKPVLTKRLGFMLEAAGHADPTLLWELERVARRIRHYVPLDRTRRAEEAPRMRRWELLVNTDIERLLRSARG